MALNPDDDIALTSKGWALIDLGKANDALDALKHATNANPRNEYAWYNLAWAQYLTGNPADSSQSMNKALAINPNNIILRRGRQMMASGKIPSRLKHRRSTNS